MGFANCAPSFCVPPLLLAAACGAVCGQAPAPGPAPAPYRLEVKTQLVLVDAAVEWAKTGKPLRGLQTSDFLVFEDEEPQTITSISEDSLPLSLVFVFDLTDTVHPVLQHLADGAAAAMRQLRPDDEVAVMTVSSHGRVEQPFTRDPMLAREGLDAASASYDRGEPTFLFEDLWAVSAQSATSRLPNARRVQLWVTDGSANDQVLQRGLAHHAPATVHGEAEAVAALLRSGAAVAALTERSALHGSGHFGDIDRLAQLTGGPVVPALADQAPEQLSRLLDGLRARYTLGYRPTSMRPEGTTCHLRVKLSPAFFAAHPEISPRELRVRAREAYLRTGTHAEINR